MDGLYLQFCPICVCFAPIGSERFCIFYFWLPIGNSTSPKWALYNSYRLLHHFRCCCFVFDGTFWGRAVAWSHFVSINRKRFSNFPAAIALRTPRPSKPPKCYLLNLELLFIPFALTVGHDRVPNSGLGVISKLSFFQYFERPPWSRIYMVPRKFHPRGSQFFSSHRFLVFY